MVEIMENVMESILEKSFDKKLSEEYIIESFTLTDAEASRLADIIKTAFLNMDSTAKHGGTIMFDEDTFKFMFCSPYFKKDLFIRAIHKATGDTVGFMGSIPRILKINDKIFNCFIPSWEAVHWKHQRKGIAKNMVTKMIATGIPMGVDAAYAMFEPEEHGINSAKASAESLNLTQYMIEAYKINKFIIRVLDIKRTSSVIKFKFYEKIFLGLLQGVKKVNNPRVRNFKPADGERLFELMKDFVEKNEISVIHEHDDFIWYINHSVINCVVHTDENDIPDGFIIAWKFNLSGFGNSTPFGWLDIVHTHRLSIKEAADLSKHMSWRTKEIGWAGLQTPYIPYFNPKPLKKAKFIFFPKKLILTFFPSPLSSIVIPKKIKSLYSDWR